MTTLLQTVSPPPTDPGTRQALSFIRERFTGLTTATVTTTNTMVADTVLVFKNGALLDPNGGAGGYSTAGKTITLGTAAIAGDVFVVAGYYRTGV